MTIMLMLLIIGLLFWGYRMNWLYHDLEYFYNEKIKYIKELEKERKRSCNNCNWNVRIKSGTLCNRENENSCFPKDNYPCWELNES